MREGTRSGPALTRPEEHIPVRPEHVQQTLLPARSLPSQRLEVRWDFRPAHGIRNKVDAVVRIFFQQVPMQTRHQVEILTNRARPITPNGAHQIRSKYAERPGNDRQHVSLSPSFSADQERAQILNDLDHFDALARQTHARQMPSFNLRSIQDADDSPYRHDSLRVRHDGKHDSQQSVAFEDRIDIHDANLTRARLI